MSNYPANIKNNIETPEGYPQIIPSAPPSYNEPIEVYAQPIQQNPPPVVYVTQPRLTIEQFQPNYVHNSKLYAPRHNPDAEFYYIPHNNNQPRRDNNNKGFFASLAACFCCLLCCCPTPC